MLAKPQATPVIVIGAGAAAAALLKDLAANRAWRVLGLLDDDAGKQGGEILGVKVLGRLERVGKVAGALEVTQAIIAMPEATHGERRRAVELCTAAGLSVMTVPALADIVSGNVSVSALRAIELDDLLGRDPVQLDEAGLHAFIDGKTVLVTGAGGSIGAELCRQIARFGPARIVLLENSEFALYAIEQEFRDRFPGVPVAEFLLDGIESELRVLEEHDARRSETRDLPAQLGADRPARAGDQDRLAVDKSVQPGFVELHRVAPEQVVELDRAQRRHADVARDDVGERGNGHHGKPRGGAKLH